MAKARSVHRCSECGAPHPAWLGRCGTCGAWGTLVEERQAASSPARAAARLGPGAEAAPITDDEGGSLPPVPTGLGELDRVLGGGLVPGSVTLLGGEPGIGKSTLVLQALGALAGAEPAARCLLVTGEESRGQVRARGVRLGVLAPELWLLPETSLPAIVERAEALGPAVLAIDSIQTLHDPELDGAPGSVGQVRECAHRLVRLAKDSGTSVVLVGHVTKDGALAGPRVLEHVVDTVLAFEGDRHHALRLLRAVKHRFGPTSELGVMEMAGDGLRDVGDPSAMFLADRRPGAPGSVVTALMEGARPVLVEIQALVAPGGPVPRRSAQGLDGSRLAMLLGVLGQRARISLADADVYASAAGGVRVAEPGADLALVVALVSSLLDQPVDHELVALGEVGLVGELRQVAHTHRRLAEAARLGYRRAIVPSSAPDVPGVTAIRVATVVEALEAAGLLDSPLDVHVEARERRPGTAPAHGALPGGVDYPAHTPRSQPRARPVDHGGSGGRHPAVPRAPGGAPARGAGYAPP
jgi:DNA repair protein RadA/Sms